MTHLGHVKNSYDPARDADILSMNDQEIAREKKVVSLEMLRRRRT